MARPSTGRKGQAINVYLEAALVAEARKAALDRYGDSLSGMIEKLLRRELELKRGLLGKAAA